MCVRSFPLHRAPQGSLRILLARIFPDASIPMCSEIVPSCTISLGGNSLVFPEGKTKQKQHVYLLCSGHPSHQNFSLRRSENWAVSYEEELQLQEELWNCVGSSVSLPSERSVSGAAPLTSRSAQYLVGDTGEGMTGCVTQQLLSQPGCSPRMLQLHACRSGDKVNFCISDVIPCQPGFRATCFLSEARCAVLPQALTLVSGNRQP